MSFTVVAILTAQPSKFDELRAAFVKLEQYVKANEPETLIYYATRPEGTDELMVVEKYNSEEAAQKHMASAAFAEFRKTAEAVLTKPFELKKASYLAGFEGREGKALL